MWLLAIGLFALSLLSIYLMIALVTLLLAAITQFRWTRKISNSRRQGKEEEDDYKTTIYVGRVSHTRLVPVVHSFNYPLFMCAIDLDETNRLWSLHQKDNDDNDAARLWPLSTVMQFREQDHYKNGEGSGDDGGGVGPQSSSDDLSERTINLVKERTNGKFVPSRETHRIVLVTHLSYYGYCFNPVSFYYVLQRQSNKMDALVLEVSNTPWNEMQCYVLHPSSVDVVSAQPGIPKTRGDGRTIESTNYQFQKTFHVSPFMDMNHLYDWTFWELDAGSISLYASMKKGDAKQFTANVDIEPVPFTPFRIAWQLIQFPIYCAIIQVWIHIEAFWLFKKGVAYQPHPEGSETTASRVIGSIMTPLFALKDWAQRFRRNKQE